VSCSKSRYKRSASASRAAAERSGRGPRGRKRRRRIRWIIRPILAAGLERREESVRCGDVTRVRPSARLHPAGRIVADHEPGVITLAAGSHHMCALLATARVLCWGEKAAGQARSPGEDLLTPAPSVDVQRLISHPM
jgi:hypothetical protein